MSHAAGPPEARVPEPRVGPAGSGCSTLTGRAWTHPSLTRMLYADGKVITPLFRAKPGDTRRPDHR